MFIRLLVGWDYLLIFVNIYNSISKLFFYDFYMSINIYLLNKIGGKSMRVNAVNYGVTNKRSF